MAFQRTAPRVPADIGRVTVAFATMKADDTELSSGSLSFDVVDASGNVVDTQSHDILPHMTAAQKTAIFNFIGNIRSKAKTEAV